jgi:putative peptide zinc metalloprotease protein
MSVPVSSPPPAVPAQAEPAAGSTGATDPGATGTGPVAVRAPGVELLGRLDGSGYRRTPGLVRRGDGQTLQLTTLLYRLLDAVDGRRDDAALAREISASGETYVEADDVRYLLDEKLAPLGVLLEADGTTREVRKANPLLALRFKFVVSDPELTRRVTAPFARLFAPWVVIPAVAAFAVTVWWLLFEKGLASPARQALYEPGLLLTVFALTIVSAAFHEFGHAAACRYGGATPGAMGGGLYLVWPAFYTDVDDSYRLGRRGRLRVDLGGLYFNALFALAMVAVWWPTQADALLLVVVTQLLQMVRQLAPFMRADGYHIIADLTGVPDLFAHLKPTLLGLWPTRWGRPEGRVLKPWARVVVTVWVLVVVPLLLGLLALGVWLLPRLAATAWHSAGMHWATLQDNAAAGDIAGAAVRVLSFFALVFPVFAISYLLVRIVRRTWRSSWRATEGRPVQRAGVLLVAALVVSTVAWAWWPNGQYTPVRSDERGTLPELLLPMPAPQLPVPGENATMRLPDAVPRAAIALVPRTPAGQDATRHPTVLLTQSPRGGGLETVLVPSSSGGAAAAPAAPRSGWVFPFLPPPEPSEGDNQAVAVNTTDGGVVYDVSYALVWVTDGEEVLHRNEAWALASCTDCKTVAVAFQVVLVIGQSDKIIPINSAVAANYECAQCLTQAIAVQLVATLNGTPSPEVEHELALAWQQLEALESVIGSLTVEQIYGALLTIERMILQVLANGASVESQTTAVSGTAEPEASTSPDAGADDGTLTLQSPSPTPSAADDGSSSPSPTTSATVTAEPSDEPTTTSSPTSEPSPEPTYVLPEPSEEPAPPPAEATAEP